MKVKIKNKKIIYLKEEYIEDKIDYKLIDNLLKDGLTDKKIEIEDDNSSEYLTFIIKEIRNNLKEDSEFDF